MQSIPVSLPPALKGPSSSLPTPPTMAPLVPVSLPAIPNPAATGGSSASLETLNPGASVPKAKATPIPAMPTGVPPIGTTTQVPRSMLPVLPPSAPASAQSALAAAQAKVTAALAKIGKK